MKTQVLSIEEGLDKAVQLIKNGDTVVFPTETVYGLGADAYSAEAVKKIFIAKGRPQDNPLIVHISSLDQVADIAKDIPAEFYALAKRFMPGPISIILKKSDKIPSVVTAGGDTVALRMPDNPVARELIERSSIIAAPSANRSKHVSPTTAKHVLDDLDGLVPLILDGGPCRVGIESTVLDLTAETPTILRPGAITAEMLLEVLGDISQNCSIIKIAKSPGMKYTHYAPKVDTVVALNVEHAVNEYDRIEKEGGSPVLVFRDVHRDLTEDRNIIDLGITADDYARNIYAALRRAEENFTNIIVEQLNGSGIEISVMNRVNKAAGGKTV